MGDLYSLPPIPFFSSPFSNQVFTPTNHPNCSCQVPNYFHRVMSGDPNMIYPHLSSLNIFKTYPFKSLSLPSKCQLYSSTSSGQSSCCFPYSSFSVTTHIQYISKICLLCLQNISWFHSHLRSHHITSHLKYCNSFQMCSPEIYFHHNSHGNSFKTC